MLFYRDLADYVAQQRARLDELAGSNIPEWGVVSGVFSAVQQGDGADRVRGDSVTRAVDELEVDALGVCGDRRRRPSRPSTGREGSLYPQGTVIRQHRHLCVVGSDDCRVLSERLGVEVTPELLGANLLIDGAGGEEFSLSQLPHGTHLLAFPAGAAELSRPPIATLVHFVKQQGCWITGGAIAERYGDEKLLKAFCEQAKDHRGIICSIEYPVESHAVLRAGQAIAFRFPSAVAP